MSRVVPHERAAAGGDRAGARTIASNPPLAVAKLKEGLRKALDPDWDELGQLGQHEPRPSSSMTEDHREGVASFLEKREPNYVGR